VEPSASLGGGFNLAPGPNWHETPTVIKLKRLYLAVNKFSPFRPDTQQLVGQDEQVLILVLVLVLGLQWASFKQWRPPSLDLVGRFGWNQELTV